MTVRATSTVLVGREADLAALRDAFRRARGDEPLTVLVGGEAGVGKTRLVDEFRRYAEAEGAQILTGQCLELGEEGLPFAPFAAVLRDLLRRDGPAAFAGFEHDFARLLPELGLPSSESISDTNRGYLFELVGGLFNRLAAQRPLVLVMEDLHWADRSTRDLIAFLIRSARTTRALLICTYRSDELHRGHPLRPFLAELDRARGVERHEVERLDRDGTHQIVCDLLGADVRPARVDQIHDRAQGNPFFVEELAASGGDDSCCDMPDTLRDLLLARVDRLDDTAQRILRIAAAGGTRIGHDLLAAVVDGADSALDDALRAAVAAQLLVADSDGGYDFRHALVREAVHDDSLPGERVRLHARYAAVIEARPELVGVSRAPAEIAYHWHAAHDHPRALISALAASTAAGNRYAYAEKTRLLERVLDLWEQVPDAAELLGMDHLALVEKTLGAAWMAGDYHRAISLTRSALAEIDEDDEPLRAACLLERRGWLMRTLGKGDGAAEMRRAYELAGLVPDSSKRVQLLADISTHLGRMDLAEGARIAREAMVAADALGDPAAVVSATLTFGRVCSRTISPEAGLAELRRAERLARAGGYATHLVGAMVHISDVLFEIGDYGESARIAADGATEATRFGISRSTGAFLLSNLAEALMALGRWDEANQRCAEAARLDPPGTLGVHWLELRARLRLARGHPGASEEVARALAFQSRVHLHHHFSLPLHELRIEAALAAGDHQAALAAAGAGLAGVSVDHHPRYAWRLLGAAARVAAPTGLTPADGAEATLVARIREVAAGLAATYPAELAFQAQVRASVDAPGAAALPAWQATVTAWRADGPPYELARALLSLAEAAAAAGDRVVAAGAVDEVLAIATALRATPLGSAALTLSRRLGLRAPGRVTTTEADPLTAREREVLRLVADGLSNRLIADQLFISPKTASVHVSRIIAKLDVANRVEAATVAVRLGLLGRS